MMGSLKRPLASVMVGVFFTAACHAGPAEGDAAALLDANGTVRGVCCIPNCGNGELALELARQSDLLILAMDEDAANVAAAREKADAAGLLGRRLYVQQGSAERIPFADHYVDLLVLTVVAEDGLSEALRDEIMRVLTPIRGRAVLADATISRPELPGSDWWPAKRRGPNNNPVSKDTVFRFPPLLQYRALPQYNSSVGAALTVDGVHYEMHDWVFKSPTRANLCGRITARSVYNGQTLWEGFMPEDIEATTPIVASTDRDLLFAAGDRGEVVRMDLKTGEARPAIVLGDETERIKWMAHADGVLFALVGKESPKQKPFTFYVRRPREPVEELIRADTRLVAWDLEAGKALWRHEEPVAIDYSNIAVHEGRLYFYAEQKRLVCLNADDGSPVWENTGSDWLVALKQRQKMGNFFLGRVSSMIVADGVIRLSVAGSKNVVLFDAANGAMLSQIKGSVQKGFILDGHPFFGTRGFDASTGAVIDRTLESQGGTAWCGLVSYAPGTGVLGHSTLGYKSPCAVGSWVAGGMLVYSPTVCDCGGVPGTGAFASGGEILERIEDAPEHPLVKGPAFGRRVQGAPAGEADWPSYRGGNLRRGSSPVAVGGSPRIAWTNAPDTPFTYSKLYNQFVTKPDDRPAPPIVVGDRVFTAASDGRVSAISLTDGAEAWTFHTDGPVHAPPAYDRGRLFVPCGDGWVYVLDAEAGELIWRRRIAPMERRIIIFGQLASNWPVLSVMVHEGVVYAAAGHFVTDGGVTLALDAETGDMKWSHFTEGVIQGSHQAPDKPAQGYGGHLAVVNDRVWGSGFYSPPLVLDRATGEDGLRELKAKLTGDDFYAFKQLYYGQGGQDVVVVDETAVLVGGNRIFENHQMREGKRQRIAYKLYPIDEKGDWGLEAAPLMAMKVARITPACDDELLVFAAPSPVEVHGGQVRPIRGSNRATVGLNTWSRPRFVQAARAMQIGPTAEQRGRGRLDIAKAYDEAVFAELAHDQAAWQKPELDVNAIALASNAVVVAHADGDTDLFTWNADVLVKREALVTYAGWKLSAFDRGSGEVMWSVELPSEPLYNGLAIAADGSVLVTFRDGSVAAGR